MQLERPRYGLVAVAMLLGQGCSDPARRVAHGDPVAHADPPERETHEELAPPIEPAAPLDLGALPAEVRAIWPSSPRTTRTLETADAAELARIVEVSGTRVVFRGRTSESFVLAADDTDLELTDDAEIGELRIERGTHRVRVRGGHARRVVLAEPAVYRPELHTDPAWFVEDVLIDDVTIDHPEGGIELRGRRAAVVRCRTRVREYSIWSGGAYGDRRSEDLIIAGNRFESGGLEATVRVHDATIVIVVDNVLVNGTPEMESSKHNLRFHGHVDRAYAARNVFVHSGVMTALDQPPQLPRDRVESVWLVDNVFHQLRPSLLELSADHLPHLVLTGNVVHSDRHSCLWCGPPRAGWIVADNEVGPYAPAIDPAVPLARGAGRR